MTQLTLSQMIEEDGAVDLGDDQTTLTDLEDAYLQQQQPQFSKSDKQSSCSRGGDYIFTRIKEMLKDGSLADESKISKIRGGLEKLQQKKNKKKWQQKYANIIERTIDVIFDKVVNVRIYRAKILYKVQFALIIERRRKLKQLQQQQLQQQQQQQFFEQQRLQRLAEQEEEEEEKQNTLMVGESQQQQQQQQSQNNINLSMYNSRTKADIVLRQRTNLVGHLKETHERGISDEFDQSDEGIKLLLDNSKHTDINKYLAYQSSLNTLDRIERKEMQVFTETNSRSTRDQYQQSQSGSSTTSAAIALVDSSTSFIVGSSKFLFPFSNYLPNYEQIDLAQLNISTGRNYLNNINNNLPISRNAQVFSIDTFLNSSSTYVACFTQYNDQFFGIALSNGVIQVRDLFSHSIYEVNHHLHYYNKQYVSRGRDILGLDFLPDLKQILAFHASGAVSLYNFKSNKLVCFLPNAFKYTSSFLEENANSNFAIIDLKILAQEEESGFEIICIATNALGDCSLFKIKKGFLSYEIADSVPIFRNETFPCVSLVPLSKRLQTTYLPPSYGKDFRDYSIVAVVSPQKLHILQIKLQKMKVKALFKFLERQDSPVRNPKCSFTWAESLPNSINNKQPHSLVFLVSFTSSLYLGYMQKNDYERHPLSGDDSRNGISKYQFELCKRIKHYTSILFVGVMYRNIFLICDYNNRVYLTTTFDLARSGIKPMSLNNLNSYKELMPSKVRIRPIQYELNEKQLRAQRIIRRQSTTTFSAARKQSEATLNIRSAGSDEGNHGQENPNNEEESAENKSDLHDSSNSEQLFYHNSVSFSLASQTCYILCEKDGLSDSQFMQITLVPWRSTLENLVKQAQYFNAMHFLHVLRQDRHKFAHNSFQRIELRDLLAPQIERVSLNLCAHILAGQAKERLPEIFDCVSATTPCNSEPSSKESSKKSSFADESNRKQNAEMKPSLVFIIEFLIECNQEEYVYQEIRSMCFDHFSSMELYVECLEPFILEGKISSVPNEVLTDIIGFYEKKKNMRMIQQVLTSLDVHNLDTKPLISLTLEKQLIPALIYLSTRQREPDFVTPLMSFWNGFVNSLRKWEEQFRGKSLSFAGSSAIIPPNLIGSSNTINNNGQQQQLQQQQTFLEQLANDTNQREELTLFIKEQIMLSNVNDLTKVKTEYLGLRTLWFFRLSMQQRLIDGEYIGDEDYVQVTLAFEIWLSYRENIRICLLRWPEVFFEVLKAFFAAKSLRILNHDPKKVELAAKLSKQISESTNPSSKAVQDFCASTRNVSPSECLLRQVIQETIDVDKMFQLADRVEDIMLLCAIHSNDSKLSQSRNLSNFTPENSLKIQKLSSEGNPENTNDPNDVENTKQIIRRASSSTNINNELEQEHEYVFDQSTDLAEYSRQSAQYLLADSSEKLNVILSLRHQNLLSNFHLFLAYLFYESQCRDDSGYLGGKFSFKSKKVIEIVFYLAKHHKVLLKLEFSKQDLYKAANTYIKDASYLTGKQQHQSQQGFRTGSTLYGSALPFNSNRAQSSEQQQVSIPIILKSTNNDTNLCNFMELAQVLRSEFMLSLIKSIYPQLSERERGELSQLLDATELVTARSHVLLLREQYHRAIECYIDSQNKVMRNLVFEWMELNLTQSQVEDEQKFQLLKEIMRKKLPDFIRIDSEKTHILFQRFLNGAEQDIISKLSDNPALQLLYISNVVKQHKQQLADDPTYADRIKVDMQILILQISLMCLLNHPEEAVLAEITNFDFYPLKDILVICLEKQYLEASCYLYLRMGQTDMAIRSQIKILDSVMRDYKRYLQDFCRRISNMASDKFQSLSFLISGENRNRHQSMLIADGIMTNGPSYSMSFNGINGSEYQDDQYNMSTNTMSDQHGFDSSQEFSTTTTHNGGGGSGVLVAQTAGARVARFNARMDKSVTKLFSMCTNNKAYDRPAEYWFLLLDLLVEIGKKYEEMDRSDSLIQMRQKFQSIIGSSIMEIAQHIPMEELIEKIRDAETKINLADLKSTFSKLLRLSIDANSILQRSLNYLLQDFVETTIYANKTFVRATSSTNYCASCLDPLSSLDSIRRKLMQTTIIAATRKTLSEDVNRSASTTQSTASSLKNYNQETDNSITDNQDDEDAQSPKIVTFNCGHSYHSECYYRSRNVHICTECLKQKRSIFMLMTQRKDVSFGELLAFIKSQQQELEYQAKQYQEEFLLRGGNRTSSSQSFAFKRDTAMSRTSSTTSNGRTNSNQNNLNLNGGIRGNNGSAQGVDLSSIQQEEKAALEEKKQFKKVKALAKLRNFDKNQMNKYNSIQPEQRPSNRSRRHKS